MINVDKISFGYNSKFIYNNTSLEVNKGEIFGLVGKNGAGKTTLFHLVLGILKPDSGRIHINGREKRTGNIIGYLPERPYYHNNFKLGEYLKYLSRISGIKVVEKDIIDVLDRVQLTEEKDNYLKNFSKGMLQRTGIAQILLQEPKIIILDEPTSGLDPFGQKIIRDIILQINKKGTTILLSTHNLYEVNRICHRIAMINNQKINYLDNQFVKDKSRYKITFYDKKNYVKFKKAINTDNILDNIQILDCEVIFPNDQIYYDILNFLHNNQIRIKNIELISPGLEEIILEYFDEKGDNNE
ncbi:MAG: ABC transporter ATP-binding protein [Halanaerobiaceae bacterium]